MLLLELLRFGVVSLLFRQLLVFLVLFRLEFLPFLFLLRTQLVLLLLVFFVQLRVPSVRRSGLRSCGKVARVDSGGGSRMSGVFLGVGGRRIVAPALFGCHDSVIFKCSWLGSGGDRWLAVIRRRPQLRIRASSRHMLSLSRYRRDMPLVCGGLFLSGGTRVDASVAAVITDACDRGVLDDPRVVNVVDHRNIHVVYGRVVEKVPVVPATAFVPVTNVTEAVVDPAIKANGRTPITFVKDEGSATPTPIGGRPKEADLRGLYPGAGHPVVIANVIIVSPVSRSPDIAVARAKRLLIDGQLWRGDRNRYGDLCECRGRYCQHEKREQHQTNNGNDTHSIFLRLSSLRFTRCCFAAPGCVGERHDFPGTEILHTLPAY